MTIEVEVASAARRRRVPPGRVLHQAQAERPHPVGADLRRAPAAAAGPQQLASFTLVLDPGHGRVGTGIGSAGADSSPANPEMRHQTTALDPGDGQGEAHVAFGFAAPGL
jgi:hypothetical protein